MQVTTCWDEALPLPETLYILEDLALRHAHLGGRVGTAIALLIKQHAYRDLCDFELNLSDPGWDVYELINCRQALGFFTKLEDLDIGLDKTNVAWEKFKESETRCKETNDLFRGLERGSICMLPRDVRVLHAARRKIYHLLGRCPEISELHLVFGPGATTSTKKIEACPQNKMGAGLECSDELLHSGLLPSLLRELPHWTSANEGTRYSIDDEGYLVEHVSCQISAGNLAFVPKNAKTYRAIVVEPVLNTLLQGGIGRYIAHKLRQVGVDISDQTRNASLARLGSIDESVATLDLSSASDTVSRGLVKFLLPPSWYSLLSAARTGAVTYKGERVALEKFSSMGNGFTFPLESLIFWALTICSCSKELDHDLLGIYGDDIICPSQDVSSVGRTLALCGFSLNTEKSFWSGPFRESCGKDYYNGILVRPYYQKHLVSGQTLFTLHNWYKRDYDPVSADYVLSLIPDPIRLFGPDGYGDGHLLSEVFVNSLSRRQVKKGFSGVAFETFSRVGRQSINRYPGDYISPLYAVYSRGLTPLANSIAFFDFPEEGSNIEFTRSGRPLWQLPGYEGYKRTKIYALM